MGLKNPSTALELSFQRHSLSLYVHGGLGLGKLEPVAEVNGHSDGGCAVSTEARVVYSRRCFRLTIPCDAARKLKLRPGERIRVFIVREDASFG